MQAPPAVPPPATSDSAAGTAANGRRAPVGASGGTPAARPRRPRRARRSCCAPARPAPPITVPVRIYVVRGITKRGTTGPAVGARGDPARAGTAGCRDSGGDVQRASGVRHVAAAASGPSRRVRRWLSTSMRPAGGGQVAGRRLPRPLGAKPLKVAPFAPRLEHAGAEPGVEQCFVVRTVETVGEATLESEPSPPVCVTPHVTSFRRPHRKGWRASHGRRRHEPDLGCEH